MNLLPDTQKENLKKGLKLRFTVVALLLLSAAFLVGLIMLLPSYFLTLAHISQNAVAESKIQENSNENILNLPQEVDSKLKFFQSSLNEERSVDVVSKIVSLLPDKVKVDSLSFVRHQVYKGEAGMVITISGLSLDRDSLVSFGNALKQSTYFSSVEVPVSSLTKERNLPFSINIFIKD